MSDFTIISYPGTKDNSLLSLSEERSRYMIPFGGRFRVVDFTLRNSFSSGARSTIIYNNFDDTLEDYVKLYGPFDDSKFPPIKVVSRDYSDISHCYQIIMESNTEYYIIYNGDIPSIIDFNDIIKRFKKSGDKAILYRININGKPSMSNRILAATQEYLLDVVNQAIEEQRNSPNIFEMIINIMLNSGIKKKSADAMLWHMQSVNDYYDLNWQILKDRELFDMLYSEKVIRSMITAEGYAHLGKHAKVSGSFISDFCHINGTVQNSIIYPAAEIHEGAVVKNSIILPFVKIGPEARITGAVVDERTDLTIQPAEGDTEITEIKKTKYMNIGRGCRIGSEEPFIKNSAHPRRLHSSITLIGKDCRLPDQIRIGGGCYVASGATAEKFGMKKVLNDGDSI